ncbi:MAG: GNAT family N-acetyltransferase [Acidimicrobiales bacterium]
MTWKPRLIDSDEFDAVADLSAVMFHIGPSMPDDYRTQFRLVTELDRTFVVDDGPTLVGTAGAFTLPVTFPGGGSVAMCGVTDVGVLPTHRRRGLLRAMMAAVVDQAVERGEPVAGLTASQGGIYRRFGYGVATRFQSLTIDRDRSAEVVEASAPGGLRLISEVEAVEALPAVWQKHWRRRAGEVGRTAEWWQALAIDPEADRDGASARFVVLHEDAAGRPDGVATYRLKEGAAANGLGSELRVDDVAAADDRIEAVLLRYLLDIDLVGQLTWRAPVDLPLRWRLADPRAVQVGRERDLLWLRPLDVAACLGARSYTGPTDGVVMEVVDLDRPDLGGWFRLEAGADGAACERVTAEGDVALATADLGAVLLSGVTWANLRRAGLVDERTPGAIDRLDALFRTDRAPYCSTDF